MSKNWKRLHTRLTLWLWRLTLPQGKVLPPFFFHQNDYKGCKRYYLYALGSFLLRFNKTKKQNKTNKTKTKQNKTKKQKQKTKNVEGCNHPPPVRRGLKIFSDNKSILIELNKVNTQPIKFFVLYTCTWLVKFKLLTLTWPIVNNIRRLNLDILLWYQERCLDSTRTLQWTVLCRAASFRWT